MNKKVIIGISVALLFAVLATVAFFVRERKIADSLELNKDEIVGLPGDKIRLSLNVKRKTKWVSDDSHVAKVSSDGMVEMKSAGKTSVEATCMKRTLMCRVIVEEPKLNIENVILVPGQEFPVRVDDTSFEVTATPDNDLITYENGKVTALKPGKSGITFQVKTIKLHCDITIQTPSMDKKVSIKKDGSLDFKLLNAPMNEKVEWKIKDTDIVEIKETKAEDLPINEDGSLKESPSGAENLSEGATDNPENSSQATTENIKNTDRTTDHLTNDASDLIGENLVAATGDRMSDASSGSTTEEIIYVDGPPEENTTQAGGVEIPVEQNTDEEPSEDVPEETPELTQHNEVAVLHAKNVGVTQITAKVNGIVYKAKIKVTGDQNLSIKGKYIALGTTKTISIDNFVPSYKVEWTNAEASKKNGEATVFGRQRGTITVKAVVDTGLKKEELTKEMLVVEKKLNMTSWSGIINESFDLTMQDGQNPEYEFDEELLSREGSHFTALKAGTTTIHVKDGKVDLTCDVEIKEKESHAETFLKNLAEISDYVKAHPDKFDYGAPPKPGTWDEVLKADKAITRCTGHIKWACSMMGIDTGIWVKNGEFRNIRGLSAYCTEVPIQGHKTLQECIDEGLFKPGDIICPNYTHIFTYIGDGFMVYDSGSTAAKTNYKDGFLCDYSKGSWHKNKVINAVYRWKD